MRSLLVVLLAIAPAHAESPQPKPQPQPQPESKAAPAPAPKAAPAPGPKATPAPAPAPKAAPKGQPRTLPPAALKDVMTKDPAPDDKVTGAPAFGGGLALGKVIVPPRHPDDQPWPKGMVMEPPDVNDPIAIVPGTDGLAPGKPRAPATWSKQLADAVLGGLGAIGELLLPQKL